VAGWFDHASLYMEITVMKYKMSNKKGQVVMNEVFKEEDDNKWYFWNEVWSDKHGPYKSKFEATHECSKYFWGLLKEAYPQVYNVLQERGVK